MLWLKCLIRNLLFREICSNATQPKIVYTHNSQTCNCIIDPQLPVTLHVGYTRQSTYNEWKDAKEDKFNVTNENKAKMISEYKSYFKWNM